MGWVAAATLVVMFPKDSWHVSVLGGTKMWVSHFSIDHVVWLALCLVFNRGSYESPVLSDTGE